MAAEGRSGMLSSTLALCILYCFLLLLGVWTFNLCLYNKYNLTAHNNAEHTKLYFFGHGHSFLHSVWVSKSLCKSDRNSAIRTTSRQDRAHASKIIMVLILLAGDIHLNPGPQACPVAVMPDAGEATQVKPPLTTPAPHAVELEEMLAPSQELPQRRHAEESPSERRARTSDRVHFGESPRLTDPHPRTGPGTTTAVRGGAAYRSRSGNGAAARATAGHANLSVCGKTVTTRQANADVSDCCAAQKQQHYRLFQTVKIMPVCFGIKSANQREF